jgi:molybdopterin converting factor small subunit
MNVRVLLFGSAARMAGAESVTVVAKEPATCDVVMSALGEQFPRLRPLTRSARLAVNACYVHGSTSVTAHDEVALISLVSGG